MLEVPRENKLAFVVSGNRPMHRIGLCFRWQWPPWLNQQRRQFYYLAYQRKELGLHKEALPKGLLGLTDLSRREIAKLHINGWRYTEFVFDPGLMPPLSRNPLPVGFPRIGAGCGNQVTEKLVSRYTFGLLILPPLIE